MLNLHKNFVVITLVCGTLLLFNRSEGKIYPGDSFKNYADLKTQKILLGSSRKPVTVGQGPVARSSSRDSEFSVTLIDSSLNGYGPYTNDPNPLAFFT